jgi:gliding motility-associated protein GldM
MIGMMYLVLTALLALNVSKSILESFVAIEENIQVANENEFARGEEKKQQLMEVATDKSNPAVADKAKLYLKDVEKIEKMSAEMIVFLDECKFKIFEECKEKYKEKGEHGSMIRIPYDKKLACKPTRMDLSLVAGPDLYDEPMRVMGIDEDIKKPKRTGIELWEKYNKYRKELTELIVKSASTPEKPYSLKVAELNEFKDGIDLEKKVNKMFEKGKISPDEIDEVKKIYKSLSKNERHEIHHGEIKGVHWVGKTFDHNPQVAGIASISALQKEILTARADAVSLIRSRVGGGEFSFNKVMSLATGPMIANNGDEVELKVLMAAFDSDKQPVVNVSGGSVKEVKDGVGTVVAKVSGSSEMKLSGTVAIAKKNGELKSMPWEHTIKIMKPQGTVSLPDMRVLYEGYANKVEGVASGYDQTILTAGSGLSSITKSGEFWIATPAPKAKTCSISISGKSSVTNKTVSLGSFDFKVKPLPGAAIYFAGKGTGEAAPKTARGLSAKFPPDIDLQGINFTILSWEMDFMGRNFQGNGTVISDAAGKLLSQSKPGQTVTFICKYTNGKTAVKTGAVTVKLQ